jgi:diacylglycerol kinase (ATP)
VPRALLITNPRARGARPEAVRVVVATLLDGGWTTESHATRTVSEVRRLSTEAASGGWDAVVVMGGDGTVIEALGPLVGTQVPLAVIPAGTGNLLAGNLGVPSSPAAAAALILGGRVRRIDLGEASWAGGSRHFVIAAGVGFDARVMDSTHPTTKRRWGKAAYFATAAALASRLRNVPHRIEIDGVVREIEAAEVIVANFGELVPNLIRPRRPIVPDDGLLDVIVVTASGPIQGILSVWETLSHPHEGEHPGGRLFRMAAREVRVEAEPAQPVELDGDLLGTTPVRTRVLPRAISIVVPR